ncbi:MAG: hypothetical protein NNA22_12310, partial [Nitrospira sp.]|nr:hypothetical protein [Nitrospira sp.]
MKWLVSALVMANVAIAGYYLWVRGTASPEVSQYVPLNADRIILQSVRVDGGQNPSPVDTQAATGQLTCVEWRGLLEADLERGREA